MAERKYGAEFGFQTMPCSREMMSTKAPARLNANNTRELLRTALRPQQFKLEQRRQGALHPQRRCQSEISSGKNCGAGRDTRQRRPRLRRGCPLGSIFHFPEIR